MRYYRPAAAFLSGVLLALYLPTLAAAAPSAFPSDLTAAATAGSAKTAGPGADGPVLSSANRTAPPPGMPDWSRVGYLGGQPLPGDEDVTSNEACIVTSSELSSAFGVKPNDGADDTAGVQSAIDHIKKDCSPQANYHRYSVISLPAGTLNVSRQMYVDASFLKIRGQGSGEGGTKLVFRPDTNTRYDTLANGRWDQDTMVAGSGNDIGSGGWVWPGRGMFRVQTREIAARYQDDWEAAPANRKDLFEGSINQHWASGVKVTGAPGDSAFSAREGQDVLHLDAKADMKKFSLGGYVWVGSANSRKFYAQQGISGSDEALEEPLHMRQQMFRVTRIDSTAHTVALDRPLEWDLPVTSLSDGSVSLGSTQYSKVTPLKAVEGVGFEDFAFTQDMAEMPKLGGGTYSLQSSQAVHNYGNMAPEYSMHGIVFKWAANSWARGLASSMTGSHPVVTEDALNLQIERNSFDGAWNKGKGGNGYLRGSRVWNSLYALNLGRNLRHFTFQWSASGNVAFRNDFDSDLNLHGGWEHNNLFEQNTVTVPYDHRSGNCSANCGGEGGEIDDGTWYPIWWAAGPKAIKWSGSSGPQNVFFNNTLIKQTTPGGPFEPYAPYGQSSGTAFQFGSDNSNPSKWRHLGQDGQVIPDWTGRETLNYTGQGVVPRDVGGRRSLFLNDTGGSLDPRQNNRKRVVTWNMQGAGSGTGGDSAAGYQSKYSSGLLGMSAQMDAQIFLLQEAGSPPPSAEPLSRIPQTAFASWDGSLPNIQEYRYGGTRSNPRGYLYWLRTDGTTQVGGADGIGGRVNLAIYSRMRIPAENLLVIPPARQFLVDARPALGVMIDGVAYFTMHGLSGSGNDDAGTIRNIRDRMSNVNGAPMPWIALGDFNRAPETLQNDLGADFDVDFTAVPTHPTRQPAGGGQATERVLDYAVTLHGNGAPNASSINRISAVTSSDHYPVRVDVSNLPDPPAGGNVPVGPIVPVAAVLRNAATTNVAGPSSTDNHVLGDVQVNHGNLQTQTFRLVDQPDFPGYYRLVNQESGAYLGQESGNRNGRLITWGPEAADQLWRLLDNGDGTWGLQNFVTDQLVTAEVNGENLRALDADGSARQAWFLTPPGEAEALDEIHLDQETPSPMVLGVGGTSTEGNTPITLQTDTDAANERFTVIPADPTGTSNCYYLAFDGRYVNSTVASDHPQDGNLVTLNEFHGSDDGYLWCKPKDRNADPYLANYAAPDQPLYLTTRGSTDQLIVAATIAVGAKWLWEMVRVGT
ncbi:RICIN domain-containing protein [Streptomyces sp. NPDC094473]|uniref:RICIN domain-containing protein n=1 Tax=unclassified Streptomyces TaxID=2593676 RepID=UPI00333331C9